MQSNKTRKEPMIMKPIKLELQALGPYKDYEIIDFKKLSNNGLFLICGETGSGKTMILDAMTYTLYGKDNGDARADLEALRCNQSDFGTDTFVKFTFENKGTVYIFEKRLICKKKNFSKSQNVFRINNDGNPEVIFENGKDKEITEFATELIGLNKDQFRQVIILPQSKFERLLTSKSDEKQEILSNIFGTKKWEEIAEILVKNAEGQRNHYKNLKENITNIIKLYECESVDDFYKMIETAEAELKTLETEFEKNDYEKQLKKLNEQKELSGKFDDLDAKNNELKDYHKLDDEIEKEKEKLAKSVKANAVRDEINAYQNSKVSLNLRQKELNKLQNEALPKSKEEYELADKKLNEHKNKSAQIEILKEQKIKLEGKKDIYKNIDTALAQFENAKKLYEQELEKESAQQETCNSLKSKTDKLAREYEELNSQHSEQFHIYNNGICGELASELKDGEPCPVCGSAAHPNKAPRIDGAVTRKALDKLKEDVDNKHTNWKNTADEFQKANNNLSAQKDKTNFAKTQMNSAEEKYKTLNNSKDKDINSLDELNNAIKSIDESVNNYNKALTELTQAFEQKKTLFDENNAEFKTAQNELNNAQDQFDKSKAQLLAALEKQEFANIDEAKEYIIEPLHQNEIQEKITTHNINIKRCDDDIEKIKKSIEGKAKPSIDDINKSIADIDKKIDDYNENHGKLLERVDKLNRAKDEVKQLDNEYESGFQQAEDDYKFAKAVRGDTGIGLQRYILAVMFSKVIAEANRMLKNVHGGRYHLLRTNDKGTGSNKRGLELKVHDNRSPDNDGRSVALLSGGEKFLVSLSLAIGMSTVAQKSGVKIDAMFIDEGFGTLDSGSIDDAMTVLSSIKKANGMVGIISHVQVLRDNIPTKLEIIKSNKGSTIKTVMG